MKAGFVFFFALFAVSSSSVFIPNIIRDFGGTQGMIGVITAAYSISLFVSYYIFGRASDVHGRRLFLKAGLLLSVFSFALQALAYDNTTLLIARMLAGFTAGMFPAALTAYVFEVGQDISTFTSYRSLGWAFGALIAGFIAYAGIFMMGSLAFAFAFAIALTLPKARERRIHVPLFPREVIKRNLNVYVAFLLRHAGAQTAWTILPLYMSNLGASNAAIGVLYFLNSGTQFLVMRRLGAYKSKSLIKAGLLLSTLVFILYPLASGYLQVAPIQVILAVAWSTLYIGCLKSMGKNIEKATSTGLLYSAESLASIIGPLICGLLPSTSNYAYVMAAAALLTLLSFAIDNLRKTVD